MIASDTNGPNNRPLGASPKLVITGLDPVISSSTVLREMAGSVAGHDVVNACIEESFIRASGMTLASIGEAEGIGATPHFLVRTAHIQSPQQVAVLSVVRNLAMDAEPGSGANDQPCV